MKKQTISAIILFVAVIALYNVLSHQFSNPTASSKLIQLKDMKTNQAVSVDFSDKPTVLVFFTSWCPYCNDDAPKIVQLQDKYKDELNVYGINLVYRDEWSEVRDYVETHGIDYPILLDETGEVHRQYGETAFPALFFIHKRGEIVDQIIGSTDIATIDFSFQNLISVS